MCGRMRVLDASFGRMHVWTRNRFGGFSRPKNTYYQYVLEDEREDAYGGVGREVG